MQDKTNEETSSQADRSSISPGDLRATSEELHVLNAESLDRVAGGPNGTIIVQSLVPQRLDRRDRRVALIVASRLSWVRLGPAIS